MADVHEPRLVTDKAGYLRCTWDGQRWGSFEERARKDGRGLLVFAVFHPRNWTMGPIDQYSSSETPNELRGRKNRSKDKTKTKRHSVAAVLNFFKNIYIYIYNVCIHCTQNGKSSKKTRFHSSEWCSLTEVRRLRRSPKCWEKAWWWTNHRCLVPKCGWNLGSWPLSFQMGRSAEHIVVWLNTSKNIDRKVKPWSFKLCNSLLDSILLAILNHIDWCIQYLHGFAWCLNVCAKHLTSIHQ